MVSKELKNSALIVAIITSLLYIHGYSFYHGFLKYWGVEETLFPITFERTLVQGYIAYLYLGAKSFLPILVACIIILIAAFVFNLVVKYCINNTFPKFLFRQKSSENNESSISNDRSKEPLHNIFVFSGWGIVVAYFLFVIVSLLITLGSLAEKSGFEMAENQHSKFRENEYSNQFSNRVEFLGRKGENLPNMGHIIVCSSTHCAINSEKEVVVVVLSDISKIISAYVD